VSGRRQNNFCERVEYIKLSKKVLYHFAKFAIINELLIIEDRRISARGRIESPQTYTDPREAGRHNAIAVYKPRFFRNGAAVYSYIRNVHIR